MIGLRLRAVMLGRHDPQVWAQYTMLIATLAILLQVLIAIPVVSLSPQEDDDDEIETEERSDVCRKGSLLAVLIVRYAAAIVLYVAMLVLVFALFAMEPDPANSLKIVPDFTHLGP